jgi:hypothetical protein
VPRAEGKRGIEEDGMKNVVEYSNIGKGTPTCYILTISFLQHCLEANAMLNPTDSTTQAIVRDRESHLGLLASLGKILRTHFSVSDAAMIGRCHGKERLSRLSGRFGRRRLELGFRGFSLGYECECGWFAAADEIFSSTPSGSMSSCIR